MINKPCEKKTGNVALIGSEAGRIAKSIGKLFPVPFRVIEDLRELRDMNSSVFIIICPFDNSELNSLCSSTSDSAVFRESLSAVIAPFAPAESLIETEIILRDSDFACTLLSRISGLICVSFVSSMFSNFFMWERTGALLPFFIHNMNNILARIMGNIELAEFHSGNVSKVKDKLAIALEGAEDLRNFLEKLSAHSSCYGNHDDLWTPGNEKAVLEMGHMSSGTSVEFTCTKSDDIPDRLPVKRWILNSLIGILSAAATISVNGCGAVHMEVSRIRETVNFTIKWNRSSRDNLSEWKMLSTADLIATAAVLASHSGVIFRLDEWSVTRGDVYIAVPFNNGSRSL
ncbi:MAG: hypothetical protein KAW14_09500 [Candidatus Aegiribacteria sp.]|nr:hypothetical protein [Candidatus Aegiribacteria sp.]